MPPFFFLRHLNYYNLNENYIYVSLATAYKSLDYFSTKSFQYFLLIQITQRDARRLSDCRRSTMSYELLNGLVQTTIEKVTARFLDTQNLVAIYVA
jgi:hypothetical protein